ncbi:MAG: universal stress protein [Ferruginibacter sp.]|nr:universal stress protein [Ferruginibacter sp.]
MEKIIAAFDGLHYSKSTRDYAIDISRQADAFLTGVFLDDITYNSFKIYDLVMKDGVSEKKIRQYKHGDDELRLQSSIDFESHCQKAHLKFNIHHDHKIALQELTHESIFADLLIIDGKESLNNYDEKKPSRFIRNLLSMVHCPVMLIPHEFNSIKKLIFFYDGSPSSVYAIKMVSYMLPFFSDIPVELLTVKPMEDNLHLPDNKLLKEFMHLHFVNVHYTVLKGLPESEIKTVLSNQDKSSLLVMGAYGRSTLSRWLRSSMADFLIRENKFPIFTAHHS